MKVLVGNRHVSLEPRRELWAGHGDTELSATDSNEKKLITVVTSWRRT